MVHQSRFLQAVQQGHRTFLLADEPGLGKTAQSVLAASVANAYPMLAVVPNVVKINWAREVERWTPQRRVTIIHGDGEDVDAFADVFVVNYAILDRHYGWLSTFGFRSMVVDEAHFIKNLQSQRSQQVLALAMRQRDGRVEALAREPGREVGIDPGGHRDDHQREPAEVHHAEVALRHVGHLGRRRRQGPARRVLGEITRAPVEQRIDGVALLAARGRDLLDALGPDPSPALVVVLAEASGRQLDELVGEAAAPLAPRAPAGPGRESLPGLPASGRRAPFGCAPPERTERRTAPAPRNADRDGACASPRRRPRPIP